MDRSDLLLENRPAVRARERSLDDCRERADLDSETIEMYQNFVRDLNRSSVLPQFVDLRRA